MSIDPKYIRIGNLTLQHILDDHTLWVKTEGKLGKIANLEKANLYNADLSYANLQYANLKGANLHNASLYYTNLKHANLCNIKLEHVNLYSADLENAVFEIANQKLIIEPKHANFFQIKGSQHWGYRIDDYVKIGCEEHTLEHWLENVETIARNHNYTGKQTLEYKLLVELASKMF